MGYSLSWIAILGKPIESIHSELGLIGTGRTEEFAESPFSAVMMPTKWYVVVADHHFQFVAEDNFLSKLSISCDVVTCLVEEHVMFSAASQWKEGRCLWKIEHNVERGKEDLKCVGELPPLFTPIRDRLFASQRDDSVDHIFDVPVELARELTGYRHDADIAGLDEDIDEPFEILEAVAPPAKYRSFFQRLFGR